MEHLSGTFTVTCGDDWGVDVLEAAFLEEFVRGVGQVVSHAHDGRDQLRAASQMSLCAQELVGVSLGRQWVLGRVSDANKLARVHSLRADLKLEWLALLRAPNQLARGFEAGANFSGGKLGKVCNIA